MKALALLAALLALWAAPALAAIGTPVQLGSVEGAGSASQSLSTTADAPIHTTIFVAVTTNGTFSTGTDTAGNSYTSVSLGATNLMRMVYANNTAADLPAPCTVTASETSTTLVVTAVVSCSSTDVLAVGQAISGGSFTGTISAPCTLVAGAATCTITGGSVVASATATISSVIKITMTGSATIALSAADVSGIATTTPLDVTGTQTTGTSTTGTTISPTVSTGTLGQANEIVFGAVSMNGSISAYLGQAPFTDFTGTVVSSNPNIQWSYDIVASTASVAYGPKWTTARPYAANVVTFKGAGAAAAASPGVLGLMGWGTAFDGRDAVTPQTITPILLHRGGSVAPPSNCPFDSGGIDDGCDALNALGQIGLYTVNSQNSADTADGCNLTPNCFFTYARQNAGSRQSAYVNGALPATHPITFNQAGGDYGIGPYTATASLTDPKTYNWAGVTAAACSYSSTNHNVRCNFTGTHAPNLITAHITSGQLICDTCGTPPTVGQYVWSAPVTGGTSLYPYQIGSLVSAGVYNLNGSPADVGSESMNTSPLLVVDGFNFDDVYLLLTGTGLVQVQNNRFTVGANLCLSTGLGNIDWSQASGSDTFVYSNYFGHDTAVCSTVGVLYPSQGATVASFNGTTSGTALTINSGTAPAVGSYINGASFSTTTQVISGSGSSFTLSNAEPSLTEAMTSGPIQSKWQFGMTSANGGGYSVAEWNYVDKYNTPFSSGNMASTVCKYNFEEVQGIPTAHIDPCMQQEPIVAACTVTASETTTTLVVTGVIACGRNVTFASGSPISGSTATGTLNGSCTLVSGAATCAVTGGATVSSTTLTVAVAVPGSTYTVPSFDHEANTVLYNGFSISGTQNGGPTGTYAEGGGLGAISFFSTFGTPVNAPGGYYIQLGSMSIKNNVLIVNGSGNNNQSANQLTTGYAIYLDTQGSVNPGPFPGSVLSATITGNYFDPHGANSCMNISPYIFTSPGGSTTLASTLAGPFGIDLVDGSSVTQASCTGQNSP